MTVLQPRLPAAEPSTVPREVHRAHRTWSSTPEHAREVITLVRIYNSFRDEAGRAEPGLRRRANEVTAVEHVLTRGQAKGLLGAFSARVMAASLKAVLDDLLTQFAADPDLDIEAYHPTRGLLRARGHPRRRRCHRAGPGTTRLIALGGEMKPYFDTTTRRPAAPGCHDGLGTMELCQFSQGLEARKGATKIGGATSRAVFLACLTAGSGLLFCAGIVPAAGPARRRRLAAGMAILVAGLVLRGLFKTLGEYFTFTVMVSSDQPVIAACRIACCATPAIPGFCWFASGRPDVRELGPPGRHGPAAAFGHPVADPHRGKRANDNARRPVPRLRLAAPAARPAHLVTMAWRAGGLDETPRSRDMTGIGTGGSDEPAR